MREHDLLASLRVAQPSCTSDLDDAIDRTIHNVRAKLCMAERDKLHLAVRQTHGHDQGLVGNLLLGLEETVGQLLCLRYLLPRRLLDTANAVLQVLGHEAINLFTIPGADGGLEAGSDQLGRDGAEHGDGPGCLRPAGTIIIGLGHRKSHDG